jgi:HPt (histidine-containing phosphotransfer) domain-containing protein
VAIEVMRSFLRSSDSKLDSAAAALRSGDGAACARTAHSMKSSAANLGAEVLATCYGELEKLGRAGRLEDAHRLLEIIRHEQRRAMGEIQKLLAAQLEMSAS